MVRLLHLQGLHHRKLLSDLMRRATQHLLGITLFQSRLRVDLQGCHPLRRWATLPT